MAFKNPFGPGSITADYLAPGAVTLGKIAADAVTAGTIAAGAVLADALGDGAVTALKLADGAVTAAALAANAVTAGKIAAGAVLTDALADAAVTTVKITDTAITAGKIAAGAVQAGAIAAGAVVADKIAAGAVTADAIAAGAVVAGKIAAGAVTSDTIAANAITAGKIAAGAVQAGTIAADAINGMTITGAHVQTADAGARWVMSSDSGTPGLAALIQGFTGLAAETAPATLEIDASAGEAAIVLNGASLGGSRAPFEYLMTYPDGTSLLYAEASEIYLAGTNGINPKLILGPDSSPINGVEFGIASITFDANGNGGMNHGMGLAPVVAFATHKPAVTSTGVVITLAPYLFSTNSVGWHARKEGGGPYVGTLSTVYYLLLA